MYNEKLLRNNLINYQDFKRAFEDLIEPYSSFISKGFSRIDIGPPGAAFSNNAVFLEGFARSLWGLIPYLAGGNEYLDIDKTIKGLTNGVDPAHNEFWGRPADFDQLLVEMAVFGYALLLIPEKIWTPLSESAKRNFARWLSSINKKKIPDCNWLFFRILVNCGLKKVGAKEFDQRQLDESLQLVEQFYLNDGWYNDGMPESRRARDYYIPWAIHYYSLILLRCCPEMISDFVEAYKERARLFAGDFLCWFSEDGSALPYGRSLTYRFAQGAFWGALAFADLEALDWGEIKSLCLNNLRYWLKQPIFSETGLLSVGYTYPNLHMAERYNSPNSPLWSLKIFIPLALPGNHPFWQAEERPLNKENGAHFQESTGFIISDSQYSGHLYAINAGQWTPGESNEHNHMAEKYSKFAYSNYFGFNVATDTFGIDKLGHDNMLLISNGDRYYRYRTECFQHELSNNYLLSTWQPFKGITIKTFLTLYGNWSLRLHYINASIPFWSAEGGFALPYNDSTYPISDKIGLSTANQSSYKTELGFSGIKNLVDSRQGKIIIANPNANIIHPHTLIPTLLGEYQEGKRWLGCAAMAHPDPEEGENIWKNDFNFEEILKAANFYFEKQR